MAREPFFARHAPQVGNHRTRKVERPHLRVDHDLGRIGVLQRGQSVGRRKGFHQRRDVGRRVVETAFHGLDLRRVDERLVALHVHHHVVFPAFARTNLLVGFPAAVRAAPVVGRGHFDLAAERQHGIADTLVVRSDHSVVQHSGDLLVHALNDGLSAQQGQRFAREARRSITRRNDC